MQTRVRQDIDGEWRVDRRFLRLLWVPLGRWIHQDWWAPYVFETASEALHFANVSRARSSISTGSECTRTRSSISPSVPKESGEP